MLNVHCFSLSRNFAVLWSHPIENLFNTVTSWTIFSSCEKFKYKDIHQFIEHRVKNYKVDITTIPLLSVVQTVMTGLDLAPNSQSKQLIKIYPKPFTRYVLFTLTAMCLNLVGNCTSLICIVKSRLFPKYVRHH